jgi:hypothetical protein
MDPNPYSPPTADRNEVKPSPEPEIEGDMTLAEAEALRRAHLTHEARLQSVGTFMLFGAVNLVVGPLMLAFIALFWGVASAQNVSLNDPDIRQYGLLCPLGLLVTAFGVMSVVGGLGLRRLDPKHYMLYNVVAAVWFASFWYFWPLGLWALYLLSSSAGLDVLSPEYTEARRRTPHIRFNSHRETFRALALLALGVALVNLKAWLG